MGRCRSYLLPKQALATQEEKHNKISGMRGCPDCTCPFVPNRAFENPQEIRLSRDNQDKLLKVSPFKATVCREDRQHIKVIKETNVETTSPQMLMVILYKTVTKPVQGHFNESYKGMVEMQ